MDLQKTLISRYLSEASSSDLEESLHRHRITLETSRILEYLSSEKCRVQLEVDRIEVVEVRKSELGITPLEVYVGQTSRLFLSSLSTCERD